MFIERIYGREHETSTLYMLRVKLTPLTRWGQLYLHIFFRGDSDRHPHDHPFDFWTFPLIGYTEEVWRAMITWGGTIGNVRFREVTVLTCDHPRRRVRAFRWHHRDATHIHRVLDPPEGKKIITLVWRGIKTRDWGFWTPEWVHWKKYLGE